MGEGEPKDDIGKEFQNAEEAARAHLEEGIFLANVPQEQVDRDWNKMSKIYLGFRKRDGEIGTIIREIGPIENAGIRNIPREELELRAKVGVDANEHIFPPLVEMDRRIVEIDREIVDLDKRKRKLIGDREALIYIKENLKDSISSEESGQTRK